MRRLVTTYDRLNTTRPILTKGTTCGALLGAGDVVCQSIDQEPWDARRTGRMMLWGAIFNGPLGHLFYLQLDRVVVLGGALGIITKIAVDQLLFTPPLTFGYFVFQHLLSAPSPSLADASTSAAGAVWPVLKVNWVYWSLVHVVTFSMVPLSYRVGFVAVKNFFWGAYLSMVGARTTAAARAGASAQGEAQSGTLAASEKARNLRLARTATQ